MEYNFKEIEKRWQIYWKKHKIFHTQENNKQKYYILNMFPYPSGEGLHIGHCLGYIASDIYARYKRAEGYNVLNPIGFDSFGLPAEQYAIQTGKHPYETTRKNSQKYIKQMNKIGLSFDWNRKLCTSDPNYYRWTQWMFIQIFNSWYDKNCEQAKPINLLIQEFNKNGNYFINASTSYKCQFNSKTWSNLSISEKESILLDYRLAFLCNNIVNWCPDLGTVLANDEIKNGKSQRGGYPVYKKKMLQWHIRISAYAERLITGLNRIDCPQSLKKLQLNWIGKSIGISISLKMMYPINQINEIELFLSRPEMIFGITFIIISTDHPLADQIGVHFHKKNVLTYLMQEFSVCENQKNISGIFTGNYVFHPFIKKKQIPIYISNYFSVDNHTKSTIGVPGHEEKSKKFAQKFGLEIHKIYEDEICMNSDFLNGLNKKQAREKIIEILVDEKKIGKKNTNYKIRDAIFSRQRYWGEPIPIYFKNKIPKTIPIDQLPLLLPKIDNYHPKNGKSSLIRAKNWAWDEKNMKIVPNILIDHKHVFPLETNTMPSWAGSSWYFLRYMDVHNHQFFIDQRKENYWKNVDLYIGGSEHSTGHLIYARFWNKFLKDRKWITTEEPFQKILNQGMILSNSASILKIIGKNTFVSYGLRNEENTYQEVYVDLSLIKEKNNELDIKKFKENKPEFRSFTFLLEGEIFFCKRKLEKMSKSKYNVINPDEICEKHGSDIFRIYEMFLGPITQSKPWDDQKINGVKNFINKFWRLFHKNEEFEVSEIDPTFKELQILHSHIKKIQDKMQSFSFNTSISSFMIVINELTMLKCNKRKILEPLVQLIAPFAPHIAEELWYKLGKNKSILHYPIPVFNSKYLMKDQITYPIMFNGKLKFSEEFDSNISIKEIKNKILNHPKTKFFLRKKIFKKLIIVPKKVINILHH